jgi:hypothetical protein
MFDFGKDWLASNTIDNIKRISQNKKIVFWGAGIEAERAMNAELSEITPAYFIDSNKSKQGSDFAGFEVNPPDILLSDDTDNLIVIVCCRLSLLGEIIEQLKTYGIKHYFSSSLCVKENYDKCVSRFCGDYIFIDRHKNHKKLLTVLTGYKEFLWESVFSRIIKYIADDIDVCLVSSGVDRREMRELAEKRDWSYLCTKQNILSTAQNIAISLHDKAEFIYKMDEDIFITEHYFERIFESYNRIKKEKLCRIGYLSPIIPVNSVCYTAFLEKSGLEEQYREKFSEDVINSGGWALQFTDEVTGFLWDNSLPLDTKAKEFWENKTAPITAPFRFSIGAIFFERKLWEEMLGYDAGKEGEMGNDEVHICTHCMEQYLACYVDTNILCGHFSYGNQTEYMRGYFNEDRATV